MVNGECCPSTLLIQFLYHLIRILAHFQIFKLAHFYIPFNHNATAPVTNKFNSTNGNNHFHPYSIN